MLPSDQELSTLSRLSEDLYEAEAEVLRLEAELKRAKRRRDAIQCDEIPAAMEDIGVLEFRTDKCKIELKPVLRVSPRKDNRPLVFREVEEAGDEAIIKSNVMVAFGRGKEEQTKELLDYLQKNGMQAKQERKIEPQTLKKWVKDRLERGEPVDMELFGVRQFKQAVFRDGAPEAPVFEEE
jgi:hypothetical protein